MYTLNSSHRHTFIRMRKHFYTLLAATMLTTSAFAIPARPRKIQVKQPDGTTLVVTIKGDENFHFASTLDGMPLIKRADGAYCYALLDANGKLVASDQLAHNQAERQAVETSFVNGNNQAFSAVRSLGAKRAAQRNAARVARLEKRNPQAFSKNGLHKMAPATGGEGIGVTGKRKGLVILVNFKDKAMKSDHNQTEWNNFFNQVGYSNGGNFGSVHDYFYNQSYGQFSLDFDVVGPVTLSKNMVYYGGNDSNNDDSHPAEMAYEACKLVDSQVNFADYDWDGDGEVDQVFIVYAGYGEASSNDENTIWQHEWNFDEAGLSLTLDGVKINTYGCSSELMGDYYGDDMDGIGTACHEFSHCLGLPDLYDTEYGGGYGMSEWDLMGQGSYNGDGCTPAGYSSYERWVSGWLQPTELKSAADIEGMKALSDAPEAYVIYNEKTPTEYYLLENRQLRGTDVGLPGHGMLVLHVDYNKKAWEENTVNNVKSHQRLSVIAADNSYSAKNVAGDIFPGTSGQTELTDTSKPAASLFNANADGRKFMGKPITDIAESEDGLISFSFMNTTTIDVPTHLTSTVASPTSFTAQWGAVEDADSYNVEVRVKSDETNVAEACLMDEDFTEWGAGNSKDGTQDISAKLDDYTYFAGWTGSKVFEGVGGAKIGSAKTAGYLTSPSFDVTSGNLTVAIFSAPYNTEASATLTLLDANNAECFSSPVTMDKDEMTVLTCEGLGNGSYKVKFAPTKRGYLQAEMIFDGLFTADEIYDALGDESDEYESIHRIARRAQSYKGITETSYLFSSLTENATYQWRVQTVKGNKTSSWSDWQTVNLDPTSVGNVFAASASLTDATVVDAYGIDGRHIGKLTYGNFKLRSMQRGTYLLRTAEGKVIKVVK